MADKDSQKQKKEERDSPSLISKILSSISPTSSGVQKLSSETPLTRQNGVSKAGLSDLELAYSRITDLVNESNALLSNSIKIQRDQNYILEKILDNIGDIKPDQGIGNGMFWDLIELAKDLLKKRAERQAEKTASKKVAEAAAKEEAKRTAEKEVAKEVEKGIGKEAAKDVEKKLTKELVVEIAEKRFGKSIAKIVGSKIPIVGIGVGLAFGIGRALSGDWYGATAELTSGVAGTFAGAGTAASLVIDAGLMARDVYHDIFDKYPEDDPTAGDKLSQITGWITEWIKSKIGLDTPKKENKEDADGGKLSSKTDENALLSLMSDSSKGESDGKLIEKKDGDGVYETIKISAENMLFKAVEMTIDTDKIEYNDEISNTKSSYQDTSTGSVSSESTPSQIPGVTTPGGGAASSTSSTPMKSDKDYPVTPGSGNVIQDQMREAGTRRLPINNRLLSVLQRAADSAGVVVRVKSGAQPDFPRGPRTGSVRHDYSIGAADLDMYAGKDKVTPQTQSGMKIMQTFVHAAKEAGATGFGAAEGYMSNDGSRIHVGFGNTAIWGYNLHKETAAGWLRNAVSGRFAEGGIVPKSGPAIVGDGPMGGAELVIDTSTGHSRLTGANPHIEDLKRGEIVIPENYTRQVMRRFTDSPISRQDSPRVLSRNVEDSMSSQLNNIDLLLNYAPEYSLNTPAASNYQQQPITNLHVDEGDSYASIIDNPNHNVDSYDDSDDYEPENESQMWLSRMSGSQVKHYRI